MLRSMGVVLAGYISIGILVVLTDLSLSRLFPGAYQAGKAPPAHLLAFSMVTATLYSVLGGWIAARLSRGSPRGHIIGLIVFGEFMGLVSTIAFWDQQPHWYALSLLVLFPPAVWLGGRLGTPRSGG